MSNPKTSVEVERKFEVDPLIALPSLVGVADIVRSEPAGVHQLEAAYFDTADFALAATGRALRYRRGGHDSGWHVKHRTPAGMLETQWSSQGDLQGIHSITVPETVRDSVRDAIADESLQVIATISAHRTTHLLFLTDQSEPVAEIADDLVTTVDAKTQTKRSWREWEVELLVELSQQAGNAFLNAVERALIAAGASPSRAASKLHRALGLAST